MGIRHQSGVDKIHVAVQGPGPQLFGEAGERQVKRHGNAMLSGIGVIPYARNWGTSSVMLLAVPSFERLMQRAEA